MADDLFDVIIVGGGPAGLSAALILGRCRRSVLICDAGHPRNAASHGLHGYLTRDCIEPLDFLRIAREELRPYQSVQLRNVEVLEARRVEKVFQITLASGEQLSCRRLLLATGVVDELPQIEGLRELYGTSVFHCPYCDGWEMRDQPLAIYGRGENGVGLALELTLWSKDLVLCTDGAPDIEAEDRERLRKNGIKINAQPISRLEGREGVLHSIVFDNGERLDRRGMFFSTGQRQGCNLAESLGCHLTKEGCIATGEYETTNVPGVYVAGDASRFAQFVIVAAAEGARAAVAINTELLKEDLQ